MRLRHVQRVLDATSGCSSSSRKARPWRQTSLPIPKGSAERLERLERLERHRQLTARRRLKRAPTCRQLKLKQKSKPELVLVLVLETHRRRGLPKLLHPRHHH